MKGSHAACLSAFAILILGIKERACAQGSLRSDARSAIPVVDDTFLTFDPVKGKTLSLAAPSHEITVNDDWRFELHARLWAMGIDGDVGARGRSASVDASFLDVMDASDSLIGVAGRIEVGKGPWGFFVDGLYDKIGVDDATGPFGLSDIDVTIDMGIVDIGAMYRLGDWPFERTGADPTRKSVTLVVQDGMSSNARPTGGSPHAKSVHDSSGDEMDCADHGRGVVGFSGLALRSGRAGQRSGTDS